MSHEGQTICPECSMWFDPGYMTMFDGLLMCRECAEELEAEAWEEDNDDWEPDDE